jgi:hypothetical protein
MLYQLSYARIHKPFISNWLHHLVIGPKSSYLLNNSRSASDFVAKLAAYGRAEPIRALHAQGRSLREIAAHLVDRGCHGRNGHAQHVEREFSDKLVTSAPPGCWRPIRRDCRSDRICMRGPEPRSRAASNWSAHCGHFTRASRRTGPLGQLRLSAIAQALQARAPA